MRNNDKRDNIDLINDKILSLQKAIYRINAWKFTGKTIVFTNGCFDLLHLGHIDYLAKAAMLGDKLVIGLNTDASVSRLKGEHRPITNEKSRASILAALSFVNAVILFDQPTPLEVIAALEPDVLVKGADYTVDNIVGADLVLNKGGQVKTLNYIDGYSTSLIEERIRASK